MAGKGGTGSGGGNVGSGNGTSKGGQRSGNLGLPSDSDMHAALRARQESLIQQQQKQQEKQRSGPPPSGGGETRYAKDDKDEEEEEQCRQNWRDANCVSTVRLSLDDDWVRRIAVDLYPLAVVGSAGGDLYLADLEDGDELDCLEGVHPPHRQYDDDDDDDEDEEGTDGRPGRTSLGTSSPPPPDELEDALAALYGKYDGGGVIAIAVKGDLVVSSGRDGGVHVCTIEGTEEKVYSGSRGGRSSRTQLQLQPQGKLRGLEGPVDGTDEYERDNLMSDRFKSSRRQQRRRRSHSRNGKSAPIITSLAFDNQGTLWAAGYDGILRGYDYEQTDMDDKPLMLRQRHADCEVDVGSPLLSVSVHDAVGCGVATTETDGAFIFSLEDGRILDQWNPFEGSARDEFARTALIVQTDERGGPDVVTANDDERDGPASTTRTRSGGRPSTSPRSGAQWSVVVGGSKGGLYQRRLAVHGRTGLVDSDADDYDGVFLDRRLASDGSDEDDVMGPIRVRPNHLGPVVALASPGPGLLVSGSHDGTMRVWDCSLYGTAADEASSSSDDETEEADEDEDEDDDDDEEDEDDEEDDEDDQDTANFFLEDGKDGGAELTARPKRPKVLYALSGYKVWLGSIVATSRRLVSDGADNSIIVHSFDEDDEAVLRAQDDDDDDLEEDLSFD